MSAIAAASPERSHQIELRDASVRYGPVQAVVGATMTVTAGERIAIVGANGSGKTSLLRLLHGVVAYSGSRQVSVAARRQAMVFQRPFLLRLSVLANLHFALWLSDRAQPRRQRAERAGAALQRVGLASLAGRPARSLSGGEQQRLALARAWSLAPGVLFLDEPTASLDPSAKKEVEAVLAGFAADGMTLVMSTHNLGQAKRLAGRVVFMEAGRIAADLPTAEFFAAGAGGPAEPFLKGDLSWSMP